MKIAIVGGAGFIGTNLYFYLKDKKHKVKIFDNLLIKKNLKYLSIKNIIKCDLLKKIDLEKKLKDFDIIINLAGQTGVVPSNLNPLESIKKNIIGFLNLIEVAKKSKIKTIINASTSGAIYGNSKKISNETDYSKPLSIYGLTKDFNEKMSKIISNKIKIIHLRFSNVYGPYSIHKKSLIHNAIKSNILDKKLVINGDGKSKRDFIYVNDVCRIIYKLIKSESDVYNVATGKSYSIKNILKILKKNKNCPNTIYSKSNKGEVRTVKISNNKIKRKLKINQNFFTRLDIGINKTFTWYKSNF